MFKCSRIWASIITDSLCLGLEYYQQVSIKNKNNKTFQLHIFSGFSNKISSAGVIYYADLIKELKNNGIEPLVTLYHWDLPQPLQDAGGWETEDVIDWFADYARICFELFGNDVKYWFTFNEPVITCWGGYGGGEFAPGIESSGIGEYICAHKYYYYYYKAIIIIIC